MCFSPWCFVLYLPQHFLLFVFNFSKPAIVLSIPRQISSPASKQDFQWKRSYLFIRQTYSPQIVPNCIHVFGCAFFGVVKIKLDSRKGIAFRGTWGDGCVSRRVCLCVPDSQREGCVPLDETSFL